MIIDNTILPDTTSSIGGGSRRNNARVVDSTVSVASSSVMASTTVSISASAMASMASASASASASSSKSNNNGRNGNIPLDNGNRTSYYKIDHLSLEAYDGKGNNSDIDEEFAHPSMRAELSTATTTTAVIHLPKLISVTVPKQPDQPAGLTLISNKGVIISAISPLSPFHVDIYNKEKSALSQPSIATVVDSGGGEGGDIAANGRENGNTTLLDDNERNSSTFALASRDGNSNRNNLRHSKNSETLHVGDEILLINSHRVKNPQRAVQLIKATRSGQLTIVVSRRRQQQQPENTVQNKRGMRYVLARLENNPLVINSSDAATIGEGSLALVAEDKMTLSSTIKYSDTVYGLQFSMLTSPSSDDPAGCAPLVRISYKSKTAGPFANTDLKLGDIVLSINGCAVRSVSDAKRLLDRSGSSTIFAEDVGGKKISANLTSDCSTRVVIMLVFSLWDLRKRILEEALDLGKSKGLSEKGIVGQQAWEASYSHDVITNNEQQDAQEEYILLRIQNTTVTFRLDFDANGICSCHDHYKSLLSLDSVEEQQRQSREIQNAMRKMDESQNNDDDESLASGGNRYTRDDALVALELLYTIHIVPLIDLLNHETRRQVQLLGKAVTNFESTNTCTTLRKHSNLDGNTHIENISDGAIEKTVSVASNSLSNILPLTTCNLINQPGASSRQDPQRRQNQQDPPSQTEMNVKNPNQISGNLLGTTPNLQNEQWMNFVRNQSAPDLRLFNNVVSDKNIRAPRCHSTISDSSNYQRSTSDASNDRKFIRQETDEVNKDCFMELNPNRAINKSLPVHQTTNTSKMSERLPTTLLRKPSIVPESSLRFTSFQSILSALSDSDDDSSGSDTTTSNSDDSVTSSDSDSSKKNVISEQFKRHKARPEHRRVSRSPKDSQFIHPPEFGKGKSSNNNLSLFDRRLEIRHGSIRKFYKVLHHVVGTGSFGTVRTCLHRSTRQRYVVKSVLIESDMKNATLLQDEIALVQRINHKNIVSVRDVIKDRQFIHIIMEKCNGGDLFDKIVNGNMRFSEDRVCAILSELLDAVAYLHERNIVHRDLKAEHIMLSNEDINSSIKIIDFGLATVHGPNDPPLTALAGSAFTIAPEVINRSYGKSCDLWSTGVISFFLLTSCMPFNGKSDEEIFEKILGGRYSYPQWTKRGLSEKAKNFVGKLLIVDPNKRLNAKQALSDAWINLNNSSMSSPQVSRRIHEMTLVQSATTPAFSAPTMRMQHVMKSPISKMSPSLFPAPQLSTIQMPPLALDPYHQIQTAANTRSGRQSMVPNPGESHKHEMSRRGPERYESLRFQPSRKY